MWSRTRPLLSCSPGHGRQLRAAGTGNPQIRRSALTCTVGLACLAGGALALSLPYTPAGTWLGLAPILLTTLTLLLLTVATYLTALQAAKIAYHRTTGRWL